MSIEDNLKEFHNKVGAPNPGQVTMPVVGDDFRHVATLVEACATCVTYTHERLKTGSNPTGEGGAVLRARLIIEEFSELLTAMVNHDIIGIADALADLEYVVVGTGVAYGIPMKTIHEIVHRSNMSKQPLNEHSKGGKGPGYFPPEPEIARALGVEMTAEGSI